jgi:hypothetical protein
MKVWPLNERARKHVAHPIAGPFGTREFADWPADQFTFRRIRDGDITDKDPGTKQLAEPAPADGPAGEAHAEAPAEHSRRRK